VPDAYLRNHTQQTTATMVVFRVGFEVGSEFVDTGGQKRDLHFWAAGITGLAGVVFDNCSFDAGCDHFSISW
jgi:hypothetical protein